MLKTLIIGRESGIRSKLRDLLLGGGGQDTSPNISYSAPSYSPSTAPAPAGSSAQAALEPPRDVTPPEGFEVVLHKDSLAPGHVVEVIAGGTAIALCNVDGTFHAVQNNCPHADGPLGEGSLDGCTLTCPYHGWAFDVSDGSCSTNADAAITTFEVTIEGDAVCVRM
jgi:nitrite reductase/ring-hydroxylating ferredoxin subunit